MTSCNSVQQGKHAEKKVISEYTIQGFKIIIHEEDGIVYYTAEPLFDFQKDPLLFAELSALVNKNKDRLGKEILRFDDLVDTIKSVCMWKVLEIDELEIDPEVFTELFIYRLIKLDRLIPALLDHYVNEIYMDQKGSALYLDHQTFGRCNTNVILDEEELEALITRIKLEHPITVSAKKPSLKIEFQTQEFHSRISMDFPPLSPNGPTFNIRKLKRKPFELLDLINLNTLPTSLGSYLVEAVINRQNITIIGEPNAGKTTLANAIDLYTPKHWRKIAIEDAIESTNQASMGFKHLSIQVDSFESN
ncbi:MAG: ATPase, T2SS/T4P/T4SS family, partial [Candidatus Heimdallarchaeaceae archaeon]